MRTKILGRTGLEVPIVGLGAIYIGSTSLPVRGIPKEMDLDLGAQAVVAAIEAGCTLIDTAPVYGAMGSERIIGHALKQRPDLAAKCTVVTKAGNLEGVKDHSFDGILKSVEGSQERLGLEQFEIVYIHDAMGQPMDREMRDDGALGALRKLQAEGVIRFIGCANNDPKTNADYIETGEFDAAVMPDAWSLLNQLAAQRILPAAEKYNVGIFCGTPLEVGLLATGKPPAIGSRRNFSPACLARVAEIEALCETYEIPLLAASLQWCTRHPQVACAIPGATTAAEATANGKAGDLEIPEAFWDELEPLVQHWEEGVDR